MQFLSLFYVVQALFNNSFFGCDNLPCFLRDFLFSRRNGGSHPLPWLTLTPFKLQFFINPFSALLQLILFYWLFYNMNIMIECIAKALFWAFYWYSKSSFCLLKVNCYYYENLVFWGNFLGNWIGCHSWQWCDGEYSSYGVNWLNARHQHSASYRGMFIIHYLPLFSYFCFVLSTS